MQLATYLYSWLAGYVAQCMYNTSLDVTKLLFKIIYVANIAENRFRPLTFSI